MRWAMWMVDNTDTVDLMSRTLADQPIPGRYLKSYDLDAYGGRGRITFTDDPAEAVWWPDLAALFEAWKQPSTVCPLRDDGKPNRPLTAYTMQPRQLP